MGRTGCSRIVRIGVILTVGPGCLTLAPDDPDLTPAAMDLSMSADLSLPDLSAVPDRSFAPDLAAPDLAVVSDLTVVPDLTVVLDLAVPDLSMFDLTPLPCANGKKDNGESDIDCGGANCAPCIVGKTCTDAADCSSAVCKAGRCEPAACNDGMKNGGETGLDCGGPCAVKTALLGAPTLGAGQGPHAAVVADFNKDNVPDLAVTNYVSANVSVFLQDPNKRGLFAGPSITMSMSAPSPSSRAISMATATSTSRRRTTAETKRANTTM